MPTDEKLTAVVTAPLDFFQNDDAAPTVSLHRWVMQPDNWSDRADRAQLAGRAEILAIRAAACHSSVGGWRCDPVVFYSPVDDGPGFIWKLDNNGTTIVIGHSVPTLPEEVSRITE